MKHKTQVIAVLLAVAAVASVVLNAAWLAPAYIFPRSELNFGPVEETLHILNQTAALDAGVFKLSFIITSTDPEEKAQVINKMEVNHVEQKEITDLEMLLNGSRIDPYYGFSYCLEREDSLQVTLIAPAGSIPVTEMITLEVFTANAMYVKEMPYPPQA